MKPSTHDLIAYLEQNELKYAQRSDDEDIVMGVISVFEQNLKSPAKNQVISIT